eukprot:s2721_g5.t1
MQRGQPQTVKAERLRLEEDERLHKEEEERLLLKEEERLSKEEETRVSIGGVARAEFEVMAHTRLGQWVSVVGSTPELGGWNPAQAPALATDASLYPKWIGKITCARVGALNQWNYLWPKVVVTNLHTHHPAILRYRAIM